MSSTTSLLCSARPLLSAGLRGGNRLSRKSLPCLSTGSAGFSSSSAASAYTLPPLPYDYAALEPVISGQIMETHHKKHHQAYVTNLNTALTQLQEAQAAGDAVKTVRLQSAVNFNGGGHINHSIFWTNLAPVSKGGGSPPSGALQSAIAASFGSQSALQSAMTAACLGVQGSGWGWLVYNSQTQQLQLVTRANQDAVVEAALTPLLGIDVWEHAYYFLYGPARADYLNNIWKVVNWKNVEDRLAKAKQQQQQQHHK